MEEAKKREEMENIKKIAKAQTQELPKLEEFKKEKKLELANSKQELAKLESKQMQDIEAVLTTDQREKLFNFRNSSRKKRTTDPGVGDRPTRDEATNDSPDPASSAKNPTSSTSNQ